MFNHSVEDSKMLIPLLENALKDDYYVFHMFESAASKYIALEYIWQFPEGGWVSVSKRMSAAISSVSQNNLQLSLAAMFAVSPIKELYTPLNYLEEIEASLSDKIASVHKRTLLSLDKKSFKAGNVRSDVHYSLAHEDHVPLLAGWFQKMVRENGDVALDDYERALLVIKRQMAQKSVFIISNNVQPIGYVSYRRVGEGDFSRLYIQNIYIDKPYRRCGIAQSVLESILAEYFDKSGDTAMLFAALGAEHALGLYRKIGFMSQADFAVTYIKD